MEASPSYAELMELEPRLADVEAQCRAVKDDGGGPWFCSNFVWLPLQAELQKILGAHRLPEPGEDTTGVLFDSQSFETAYVVLSKLLPPCRDCGCCKFEPVRESQLGAG